MNWAMTLLAAIVSLLLVTLTVKVKAEPTSPLDGPVSTTERSGKGVTLVLQLPVAGP
jgi:hypothetical protein